MMRSDVEGGLPTHHSTRSAVFSRRSHAVVLRGLYRFLAAWGFGRRSLPVALLVALLLIATYVAGRGGCDGGGGGGGVGGAADAIAEAEAGGAGVPEQFAGLTDLVVVAGHGVYTGTDFMKAGEEDSWYLESFQKHEGQAMSFVEQMRAGVRETAHNTGALLLFSGGTSRPKAGPLSEGQSYWRVSDAFGWFGEDGVKERVAVEEYARDSYENLLFSICRFHELTGTYPQKVTVVSYEFKRERFSSLHRAAIAFPSAKFSFVGTPGVELKAAEAGERNALAAFKGDPYGCRGDLRKKRHSRDPFANGVPYYARCPAMRSLLGHCGPKPYVGRLPWDE